MKDYYEILGVEEEASGEEIRARWAELIKHYHPDLWRGEGEDERIKEINEAYEILKNESTRFDYDLEMTLKRSIIKKTRSPNERKMNLLKIILPAGILVVFLIVGLMSFSWFHVAAPPKSDVPHGTDQGLEKKTASPIPPVKTESGTKMQEKVAEEIKSEVMPQESKGIVSTSLPRSLSGMEGESKKKEASTEKILPESVAPPKVEKKVVAKEEPRPIKVEEKVPPKEEPRRVKEPYPQALVKSGPPVRAEEEVPKEVPREVPKEVSREVPKKPPGVTLHPGKTLAITPPSSLASEGEVKQFFSSYIDRYHQKDIDGFLSFFSSKAVQNQKGGLKEIRNIYAKFFDQSRDLRYRVEGMKTEIYQNAVEVKARFRVDQVLKRGGEEKVWTGTISWVLVKEDGALKIISLDYQNEKSP